MATLSVLPTEIVLMIFSYCQDDPGAVFGLGLSCQHFRHMLSLWLQDKNTWSKLGGHDFLGLPKKPTLYQSVMFWAIIKKRPDVVRFLIDVGVCGVDEWCLAANSREKRRHPVRKEDVKELELDEVSACLPLHVAARVADVEIVKLLLAKGADVTRICSRGRSALHHVAGAGLRPSWHVYDPFRGDGTSVHLEPIAETAVLEITRLLCSQGTSPDSQVWNKMVPLFYAARSGYVTVVEYLLPRTTNIRSKSTTKDLHRYHPAREQVRDWIDSDDECEFYSGTSAGDGSAWDSMSYKFRRKLVIDDRSYAVDTAARRGHYRIVQMLAESGAMYPLALCGGRMTMPDSLLRALCDSEEKEPDYKMIRIVLGMSDLPDRKPVFVNLAAMGQTKTLRTVLKSGFYDTNRSYGRGKDTEYYKEFALIRAGRRSHVSTVKCLLAAGVKPQYCLSQNPTYEWEWHENDTEDPWTYMSTERRLECVTALLEAGMDINILSSTTHFSRRSPCPQNYHSGTMAHQAIVDNDLDLLRLLQKHGANFNIKAGFIKGTDFQDLTPLMLAFYPRFRTSLKTIQLLLEDPLVDISLTDSFGRTALHYATNQQFERSELFPTYQGGYQNRSDFGYWEGHDFVVETWGDREPAKLALLLSAPRIDVEAVDHLGRNALDHAVRREYGAAYPDNPQLDMLETTAKALIAAGVPVEKDALGNTPLHYAAMKPRGSLVRLLLDAGADVNAVGECGRTPVMNAACAGCPQTLEVLLEAGGSVDRRDADGKTALHAATEKNEEKKRERYLRCLEEIWKRDEHMLQNLHLQPVKVSYEDWGEDAREPWMYPNQQRHCILLLIARGAVV